MSAALQRRVLARMLDANINRAFEGLRVCEDLLRFGAVHGAPYGTVRALRHALSTQVAHLPMGARERVAARNSRQDPGRAARPSKGGARSLEHLLLINLQRAKEALRVLEEASRLFAPRRVAGFQRLRFRLYNVERELLATVRHR